MKTLAEYKAPKQRMTREYSVVLVDLGAERPHRYVVWYRYSENVHDQGEYFTAQNLPNAWKAFTKRVKEQFHYTPATWDASTGFLTADEMDAEAKARGDA